MTYRGTWGRGDEEKGIGVSDAFYSARMFCKGA